MAGDVLWGDVLLQVTFCGVTFCGVTFCGVMFCRGTICTYIYHGGSKDKRNMWAGSEFLVITKLTVSLHPR